MEKLYNNYYVDASPVLELLVLMMRLAESEKSKRQTYHKSETKQINEWITEQQNSLPTEILEEINVFFHPDSFFGLSLTQVIYQSDKYKDIEDFLSVLKKIDAKKIVSLFFNTGHNTLEDESIIENPAKVHEHIKSSTLPMNEKSKLFYLAFNPEETKERLIKLIEYCYDRLYKPNMKNLNQIHTEGIQKMKQLSIQQLNEILNFDRESTDDELPKTIVIMPSYYLQHNVTFSYDPDSDIAVSVAGLHFIDDLMDEANTEEKILEFARALSDSNRINIIRQLNKVPHYGFELAQALNLSSPTISHHMSLLFRLGLVTTSKDENKIYYEVNKEKLKQSFAEMIDLLT